MGNFCCFLLLKILFSLAFFFAFNNDGSGLEVARIQWFFFLQFEEGPLHQKSFDHRSVSVILESLKSEIPCLRCWNWLQNLKRLSSVYCRLLWYYLSYIMAFKSPLCTFEYLMLISEYIVHIPLFNNTWNSFDCSLIRKCNFIKYVKHPCILIMKSKNSVMHF